MLRTGTGYTGAVLAGGLADLPPVLSRRGGLVHRLLTALQAGTHRARRDGFWAGRAAERARILRTLHDTVLQDLEAMSLASDLDRTAPAAALAELRSVARCRAVRLRRAMSELTGSELTGGGPDRLAGAGAGQLAGPLVGEGPRGLVAALTEVTAEVAAAGLRVELVAAERLPELAAARCEAVCSAVREALGNVIKHAGVGHAVVRIDSAPSFPGRAQPEPGFGGGEHAPSFSGRAQPEPGFGGGEHALNFPARGVEVVVRDNGAGFDAARTMPGFGIQQSITSRIREVGGTAAVTSCPGRGTRVRLWVPR